MNFPNSEKNESSKSWSNSGSWFSVLSSWSSIDMCPVLHNPLRCFTWDGSSPSAESFDIRFPHEFHSTVLMFGDVVRWLSLRVSDPVPFLSICLLKVTPIISRLIYLHSTVVHFQSRRNRWCWGHRHRIIHTLKRYQLPKRIKDEF